MGLALSAGTGFDRLHPPRSADNRLLTRRMTLLSVAALVRSPRRGSRRILSVPSREILPAVSQHRGFLRLGGRGAKGWTTTPPASPPRPPRPLRPPPGDRRGPWGPPAPLGGKAR